MSLKNGVNGREATVRFLSVMGYREGDHFWITADNQDFQAIVSKDGFRIIFERCKWITGESRWANRSDRPEDLVESVNFEWRLRSCEIEDGHRFMHKKALQGKNIFYRANHLEGGIKNANFRYSQDIFIECDDKSIAVQLENLEQFCQLTGLKPTAVVSSGGKSIHIHFRISERLGADEWVWLMKYVCAYFEGDAAIVTLSRKMRLPGFSRFNKDGTKKGDQTLLIDNDSEVSPDVLKSALDSVWGHSEAFTLERFAEWVRAKRKQANGQAISPLTTATDAFAVSVAVLSPKTETRANGSVQVDSGSENPYIAFHESTLKPALARLLIEQQFGLSGYDFKFKKVGSKLVGCSPFSATNSSGTSFQIDTRTGEWVCHASGGEGGHIEQFLSLHQFGVRVTKGIQYISFVKWLADRLGIEIPTEILNSPKLATESSVTSLEDWKAKKDERAWEDWKRLNELTPDVVVNQEKISFETPAKGECLVLSSGIGSGKTTGLRHDIENNPGRKNLIFEPTNRLGVQVAGDLNRGLSDGRVAKHLRNDKAHDEMKQPNAIGVGCLESLIGLDDEVFEGAQLTFDELDGNVEALLNRTTKGRGASEIRRKLKHALNVCHSVIGMSGTMSDTHVKFLRGLAPHLKMTVVKNEAKSTRRKIYSFADKKQYAEMRDQMLLSGKRLAIGCDEKAQAHALDIQFKKMGLKGLCLTGKTQIEPWAGAFTDQPNEFLMEHKPQYVLYNSVIGSGFSCDIERYWDAIFIEINGVLNPSQALQLMGRWRDAGLEVYCYIAQSTNEDSGSTDEAVGRTFAETLRLIDESRKVTEESGAHRDVLKGIEEAAFLTATDPYNLTHEALRQRDSYAKRHLRKCFHYRAEQEGHIVEVVEVVKTDYDEGTKEARKQIKRDHNLAVFTARVLDADEYEETKIKIKTTQADQHQIERHLLEKAMPGIQMTEIWQSLETQINSGEDLSDEAATLLNHLVDGTIKKEAEQYLYLHNLPLLKFRLLKKTHRWAKERHISFSDVDSDYLAIEALIKIGFLDILGIDGALSKDHPVIAKFIKGYDRDAEVKVKLKLDRKNPMTTVSKLLTRFGYSYPRVKVKGIYVRKLISKWDNPAYAELLEKVQNRLTRELEKYEKEGFTGSSQQPLETAQAIGLNRNSTHSQSINREDEGAVLQLTLSDAPKNTTADVNPAPQIMPRNNLTPALPSTLTQSQRDAILHVRGVLQKAGYAERAVEVMRANVPRHLWSLIGIDDRQLKTA